VKISVTDDQPMFHQGLIGAVITAGHEYVKAHEHPDISILGTRRGLLPTEFLHPTIVITSLTDQETVVRLLKAGAKAVLPREATAYEVMCALAAVIEDQVYIQPTLAASLLMARLAKPKPNTHNLTHKESIVVALVRKGKSNKEIARETTLSEKTIKHHMTSILQKTGTRNRVEVALLPE
jgi:two-component system, NarL family, nitrate/nitrite response regulator NarL